MNITKKKLVGFLAFTVFVFSGVLISSKDVLAGFLSIFPTKETEAKEPEVQNIQNLGLLSSNISVKKDDDHTTEDLLAVEGGALVPGQGPSGGASGVFVPASSDDISLYIVRNGDTLSEIAKMYNVSVNTIIWANDLKGKSIRPGQELVILPVSGIRHIVKSGDTLKKIASMYSGDEADIALYNGLSTGQSLIIGMEIIVPNGEVVEVQKPTVAKSSSSTKSSASSAKTSSLPNKNSMFIRPLAGGTRTQGYHGKNAVDIGAPTGTPIYAAASGRVILADAVGYNGGYGEYVIIDHGNGVKTLYAHMSRVATVTGANVSQGEVIGYVGSTGRSTGPHLHWEVNGAKNPIASDPRFGL
ncbi:peptidoglycan DD-metalloendopeptidase family protein [Candidatus Nomurabacteria bacterium]|nr:peptidoglycan DD-metalloendopeptidase family protein [Candidatus Nomurabacteria bacterium]